MLGERLQGPQRIVVVQHAGARGGPVALQGLDPTFERSELVFDSHDGEFT